MSIPPPFRHRAWGLTIASDIALAPFLSPARDRSAPDVVVARRGGDAAPDTGGVASIQRVRMAWPGVAFDVRDGRSVSIVRSDGISDAELAQFVSGPAMAAVMTQRGHYVVHASAVRLAGEVIAFTAASGTGKSTLAVLLSACGAEFLADDLVAVRLDAAGPRLVIGPRIAKVSDERLVAGWEVLTREDGSGRCVARPCDRAADDGDELPLDRICIVVDGGDGDAVRIEPMAGSGAVVALAQADFGAPLVPPIARAAFLARARDLAAAVTVVRLTRPRRLDVGRAVGQALFASSSLRD